MNEEPDPMDSLVARIMDEGETTHDAFAEGRKCGGYYAGLRSGAGDFGYPLPMSAAVRLTETWMTGDVWIECEVDEDEPG